MPCWGVSSDEALGPFSRTRRVGASWRWTWQLLHARSLVGLIEKTCETCAHDSKTCAHDYSNLKTGRNNHNSVLTVSVDTVRLVRELEGAVDLLAALGVAEAVEAPSPR